MKYCITCNCMVEMYWNNFHLKVIKQEVSQNDFVTVAVDCHGPFAECPPPDDLEENWQDNLPALSPGEYYLLQGSRISFDVETDQNIILELI